MAIFATQRSGAKAAQQSWSMPERAAFVALKEYELYALLEIREIREIRIRPRLRHCKCWPCDALRQPRSPVWLKVLVSPGIASAY
jgi:hypothetical protein